MNILVSMMETESAVKVNSNGPQEIIIKVNTLMMKEMDMEK